MVPAALLASIQRRSPRRWAWPSASKMASGRVPKLCSFPWSDNGGSKRERWPSATLCSRWRNFENQVAKLASLVACGPSFSWRPALMIDDPSIQRQNLPASSTFRVRQSPTKRPVRWWTSPPQGGRSTTTRLPATSSLAVNLHSFITFIAVHLVFTWLVKSLLCAATSGEHPMMAPTFCRFL